MKHELVWKWFLDIGSYHSYDMVVEARFAFPGTNILVSSLPASAMLARYDHGEYDLLFTSTEAGREVTSLFFRGTQIALRQP